MIFSNKVNRIVVLAVSVLLIVCSVQIYDVNRRFPNAKVISNDENNCIYLKGCQIKALDKTLYTVEEFLEAFPNDTFYRHREGADNRGSGMVVYRVEVTNHNDRAVSFVFPIRAAAAAFPSTWSNGLIQLGDDTRIEAGETKIMTAYAFYAPTLIHFTQRKKFADNEFQLIFTFYPERIVLRFD